MPDTSPKFDPIDLRFGAGLETRATAEGRIEGLASPFGGTPDGYGDIIAPGAFKASLAAHAQRGTRPAMLWGHDPSRPVGRWDLIEERADGLHVAGSLNLKTSAGRDAFEHLRAGDLDGLSIGFRTAKGGASLDPATGIRTLSAVELEEVSLVAMPAARAARVRQVKSLAGPEELRQILRDAGLSHRAADKIARAGFAALGGADPADLDAEERQLKAIARELRAFTQE